MPKFTKPVIGLIGGRGTLGQIFTKALRAQGYPVLISGRKPNYPTILSNQDLIQKSDIVIVSVFLADSVRVIQELAPFLKPQQLFCDFTSLKSAPVKALSASQAEVVGLHPMFGSVLNLTGQNIFACPVRVRKLWPRFQKILTELGLKIQIITPKKHDELMNIHQNLPHSLFLALARLLQKKHSKPAEIFACTSPTMKLALLLIGRMLAQPSSLYANLHNLNPSVAKTEQEFLEIFAHLHQQQGQKFQAEFEEAAKFFTPFKKFACQATGQIFTQLRDPPNFGPSKNQVVTKISNSQPSPTATKKIPLQNTHQTPLKIALLGPATQSELALQQLFATSKFQIQANWQKDNTAIFEALQQGSADLAFVPLENSSVGLVRLTLQNLFKAENQLQILREVNFRIQHALLGQQQLPKQKVQKIFAHPQAKAQTIKFLNKNFPKAAIIEVSSTGVAVESAEQDATALAIGPSTATQNSKLQVLANNLEDTHDNQTRFILLARKGFALPKNLPKIKPQKTALAFYFTRNQAGQLARALNIFAAAKVNLFRLESIPTTQKPGDFFFFVECEETQLEPVEAKLREIAKVANLGQY